MKAGWFTSSDVKDWHKILDHARRFEGSWIFRGQSSDHPLATSLERACIRSQVPLTNAREVERRLLREFQRRFHFYAARIPDTNDDLQWLAIMQHHGAPTRLLDWTYSFFVAAYFALESAETDCVVWALDTNWLKAEIEKNLKLKDSWQTFVNDRTGRSFRDLFLRDTPELFVYTAAPLELNERLAIQQGLFLCPGDVGHAFESNIQALTAQPGSVVKITIPIVCRPRALRDLHRMNMNAGTLFPGLDGFARSMWTRLEHLSAVPIKV